MRTLSLASNLALPMPLVYQTTALSAIEKLFRGLATDNRKPPIRRKISNSSKYVSMGIYLKRQHLWPKLHNFIVQRTCEHTDPYRAQFSVICWEQAV